MIIYKAVTKALQNWRFIFAPVSVIPTKNLGMSTIPKETMPAFEIADGPADWEKGARVRINETMLRRT